MDYSLKGAEELKKNLKALKDDVLAVRQIRAASSSQASLLVKAMILAAPEDTGRLKLFISKKTNSRKGRVRVQVGVLSKTQGNLDKLGLKHGVHYAAYTNYGTRYQTAQHWADRAIEANAQLYLDNYMADLKRRVERVGK